MTQDTGWTIAYRVSKYANHLKRVSDVDLSWHGARVLADRFASAMPDAEVYYVSTLQAEEDGRVCEEDRGNMLLESGKRVKFRETGVLPEGVVVPSQKEGEVELTMEPHSWTKTERVTFILRPGDHPEGAAVAAREYAFELGADDRHWGGYFPVFGAPAKPITTRKLTETQQDVLEALRRYGRYEPGGGWSWNNHSTTVRVLETLVQRGLARVEKLPIGLDHITIYRPVEN